MSDSKIYIISLFLFVSLIGINGLSAQIFLPKEVLYKTAKNHIKLRWEPASIDEWKASYTKGYQIQVFNTSNPLSPIASTVSQPATYDDFNSKIITASDQMAPYFESSRALLHPNKAVNAELNNLLKAIVDKSVHTKDSFRLSFLSFYSSLDFNLAVSNGLGAKVRVPPGDYVVKIKVPGFDVRQLNVRWNESQFPKLKVPKIEAKWGDRIADLEWKTVDGYKTYFGYFLDKSIKENAFIRQSDMPMLDPAVGVDGGKEFQLMQTQDSLDVNNIPITYRLRAIDYFGDVTTSYSEVKGMGQVTLKTSPILTMAEQMPDNTAHLEWKIFEDDQRLIKDFSIYRSEEDTGPYEEVKTNIPNNQRETFVEMKHERNFFRIVANPIAGTSLSTMPAFVMGIDTLAPELPQVIGATIDTNGLVNIKWHANHEDDLWGYRIFRANFGDEEYSLLNATPTLDTTFVDTVVLAFGTTHVFYVLQAADDRNNRSDFTEPIKLEKPDIVPPGAPFIESLSQQSDTIIVNWLSTGSSDVVYQELFRRELEQQATWTMIARFDTIHGDKDYVDLSAEGGKTYAYTMRAIDDVGLISPFADIKTIVVKEKVEKFVPFKDIQVRINKEKKQFTLFWQVEDLTRYQSVLLYRGWEENRITKYKYVKPPMMSITEDFPESGIVFFRLKPSFEDQHELYFSDVIAIDINAEVPKEDETKIQSKKNKKRKKPRKRRRQS